MSDRNDTGKRPMSREVDVLDTSVSMSNSQSGMQSASAPSSTSGRKKKNKRASDTNPDYPTIEYTNFLRDVAVNFYEMRSKETLTREYISKGINGMDKLHDDLRREFLFALSKDEAYGDAQRKFFKFGDWLETQLDASMYNMTQGLEVRRKPPRGAEESQEAKDLRLKVEWFKAAASHYSRNKTKSMPWQEQAMKAAMEQHMGGGVVWIPDSARVLPMSGFSNEGGWGKVRKVRIEGMVKIPNSVYFAGKESKAKDPIERRTQRSVEALVCPLSHPGIIKFWAIHSSTMEAYTLWWNGGCLREILHTNSRYSEAMETRELYYEGGIDVQTRTRLVAYRHNRTKLAWALIYLMDLVHKSKVLHNDLSPSNIMFHFPEDNDKAVFIGICDWGLASRTNEDSPSVYGYENERKLNEEKGPRWWVAPELFYVYGARDSSTSLERMRRNHLYSKEADAYSVGRLATTIFNDEFDKEVFVDTSAQAYFKMKLKELCEPDPRKRVTLAKVVEQLTSPPFKFMPPEMCFRRSI